MAFRSTMQSYWKTMVNNLRPGKSNSFSTSTFPKLKAYSPTFDVSLPSQGGIKSKLPKGEYFPILMSIGLIVMQFGFGAFTGFHQLNRCPNVLVKKSKRETFREVVKPEEVAEEAEKFLKDSFFRKVAHIQEFDNPEVVWDPTRGDVFTRPIRMETLKDVGVDPSPH